MDLDQVANVAEIVGAILVVVTLGFLTLQIRQNTQAIRATTMKSALQSEMGFAALLLHEAGVWEKILTGVPLVKGEETRKAILLFNAFMIDTEARYHQFTAGYLNAQAWEGRLASLSTFAALPSYSLWRESIGGMSRSADFLALMDELAKGSENGSTE